MKKIFQSALFLSVISFAACGDAGDAGESTTADTTAAETATPAVSPVVSKSGLPLGSDQEVPANNSTGKGTADVTYNKETKMLTYTVNYEGLSAKPTMAHIHGTAARGANAGVAHDLTGKLEKEMKGSFTDSVKIDGAIKEDSLLSGFYYFNIHTPKNPGGEIRGQIEF